MFTQNHHNQSRSIENPDTNHATYLLPEDLSDPGFFSADFRYLDKEKHYQYLKDLNSGRITGLNRYNDRLATFQIAQDQIDALSSQLDLTNQERQQARRHFLALDRQSLGLDLNLVSYCVCAYVVEQNERNKKRRCHPNVPDEQKDDLFQQIAESLDLSLKGIVKTYGKIRHRAGDTVPPVHHDRRDPNHYPQGKGGI